MIDSSFLLKWVPTHQLFPGQLNYSERDVKEKVDLGEKLDLSKPQRVVEAPYGYVLIDGHHHLLAHKRQEPLPEKILVSIEERYHLLSEPGFIDKAKEDCNIWPFENSESGDTARPLAKNWNLKDDKNLYFIKRSKVSLKQKEGICIFTPPPKYNFPLWVKVEKDIPYLEMVISKNLHPNIYSLPNASYQNSDPFEEAREKIHRLQKRPPDSHRTRETKIDNVLLIYPACPYREIPYSQRKIWHEEYERYIKSRALAT